MNEAVLPLLNDIPAPHDFASSLLREYDIRGVVGDTLSRQDALALGWAFGTYVVQQGGQRVCVGYDGRHSSPDLSQALITGLTAVGLDVDVLGLGPTPMVYFALKDRLYDAAVMVTGSHNPKSYNGFKMALQSRPVFGQTIQEVGAIAASGSYNAPVRLGVVKEVDLRTDYVARLLRDLTVKHDMRVAWDAGHGAAASVLPDLLAQLPGEHFSLYNTVDGDFPAHHPDPTVDENLHDLMALVQSESCDLGIAFDGDGDRIGVVDANGQVLRCDNLLGIYAADVLAAQPGAPIIGDVKCSGVLFTEIERLGGQAVMWKTGHSLIKDKMAELKAPLAGELSGHIFFNDRYYGFDDALYCAVRLLNAVDEAEGGLAGLVSHLPQLFNTPEIRITVPEEDKFSLAQQIADYVRSDPALRDHINDIDGVRYDDGPNWWLLRPSNTQNAFVIRFEADSVESLKSLQEGLLSVLKPFELDALLTKELERL